MKTDKCMSCVKINAACPMDDCAGYGEDSCADIKEFELQGFTSDGCPIFSCPKYVKRIGVPKPQKDIRTNTSVIKTWDSK